MGATVGRRREFGSVRKLPSGRYQAACWHLGERHVASSTFVTKADAAAFLRRVSTEIHDERWTAPAASKAALGAFAREWLSHRTGLRPRTLELYEGLLNIHVLPIFGEVQLRQITTVAVRAWHAELNARHPSTAAKAYRLLRQILNQAVDDEILRRNPCRIKGAGTESSPRRPLISLDQAGRLEAAMSSELRLSVTLAVWLGLRRGEILGLQRGDVDLVTCSVRVERASHELSGGQPELGPPKTEAGARVLHVPPQAFERIAQHLEARVGRSEDSLLFSNSSGDLLRAGTFHRHWVRARRTVGLEQLHFHDLRHLHLTLVASTGASLAELMARAGHVSPRAALIYQHSTPERDQLIAERLGGLASTRELTEELPSSDSEIAHGSRTRPGLCSACQGRSGLWTGTSIGAGDGNRTRVLSLGSEPGRLQILAYGPESLRFQESSDSR